MKSRTSLFNPTAFRKDVTRFATSWVLYIVALFMILTVVMMDSEEYYRAANLADSLAFMAVINLGFGLLNAQLLFGDLFNARHCNALHAMPLRRECWFFTHVVSGLLFSLVPNLMMTLVCLPMLGGGWTVAFWWLLAVSLQYLFFFGVAVVSALCVGNRFAMVLVYGIINFFAVIVYWFYYSLYEPMLYGVYVDQEPFLLWCPVWEMIQNTDLVHVARRAVENDGYNQYFVESVASGEGWGYLVICAVLGVVFICLALMLYRRRKLESAGDFMAVRALEPVFLVLGFIVGFFTGRMLLMRTTRVFQLKGFLWFACVAAAFALTMVVTWLDPIGVTRYIPDTDDIAGVKLSNYYNPYNSDEPTLTEDADIEIIRQLHQLVLDGKIHAADPDSQDEYYNNLCLYYELDNGMTVVRKYEAACSSPVCQLAATVFTRPEYILGTGDADVIMKYLERVYFDQYKLVGEGVNGELYMNHTNKAYLRGLVEAILADCAEGTMAQNNGYHADEEQYAWIEFSLNITEDGGNWYDYHSITIYPCNRNTVAYLEENPFPVTEIE